jgi:hypothetical protein
VEGQNRPSSSEQAPHTNQDVGMQMIQALRDVTAAAGGSPHRQNNLVEEYPCGMTMREYYDSLPEPWDVALTEYGLSFTRSNLRKNLRATEWGTQCGGGDFSPSMVLTQRMW